MAIQKRARSHEAQWCRVNTAIFPIGVKINPKQKVIRYSVTGA